MAPDLSFAAVCAELDLRKRITMGLDRVERLLSFLGDPQKKLKVVQVVGTNGKGTTAVALAAALSKMGQPAGVYLSPHVLSYTERVMIGGGFASEESFAGAMGEAIEVADRNGVAASQFELLTAGAVKLFADRGLSWAVMEAGLGARHDATTAAGPEAVVLTNVGLDHAEYLGETVAEITHEKLASVSEGSVLILGTDDPVVRGIAARRSDAVGARLVEAASGPVELPSLELPPFVLRDASLGVRAAEELLGEELGVPARERVIRTVFGTLPGRFEVHEVGGVPVVVDGGHNVSGVEAALEAMEFAYAGRPLAVVFGVLRDKDARSMLTALSAAARTVVLTRPEGERAAGPDGILEGHEDVDGGETLTEEDPARAVDLAVRSVRGDGGVVLVLGSFQTAAPVLRWLRD
ncbi:MAG: Dihydrofolate synthase @ Folylpolyglutamate synthase [uncultured Rubrobacteraceae bacterium]|uniref:tetrahydrofolate synthase n=1 Tax=uncultured Rubrobacteraceae bacterium TaxID=349277 RepID=A0A6J4QEP0_9ACTN|nr:MAG: Dihydrofolate synthase @ Folylpolyglutamate synthase [uncultured Rubrobacteraceae bacterium]